MIGEPADALVFFGATGDLAFKKIFPAFQAMIKRGTLNIPVVGLARMPQRQKGPRPSVSATRPGINLLAKRDPVG